MEVWRVLLRARASHLRRSASQSSGLSKGIERAMRARYDPAMSASQIIDEITKLAPEQRADVVRFARQFEGELVRRLTPEELGELAERLVTATSEEEADAIKKAMIDGFYGAVVDA